MEVTCPVDIVSFLVYCVIVTVTPGPSNIAILSIAASAGVCRTTRFIAGAILAFSIIMLLCVLLNHTLSAVLPALTVIIRYAGAAYMLYLAWQVLRMHSSGSITNQAATFISGFVMQFNQSQGMAAGYDCFPDYIMPYYTQLPALLGFSMIITAIALMAFILWALFGLVLIRFLNQYQKAVTIVLALLLLYSSVEVSGLTDILMG